MSTKLSIPLDIPDVEILDIKLNKRGDYLITIESPLDSTPATNVVVKLPGVSVTTKPSL